MKSEVFVSYSRRDWDFVIQIVQRLQDAGASIWVDQGGIDGALLWSQEIVEAIDNCKVMLLMASEGSFTSTNVVKEVAIASESNKYILPILLEPLEIPKTMKYQLAGVQHIEFFRGNFKDNMQAIVRSLSRLGVHVNDLAEVGDPPTITVTSPHNREKYLLGGDCLILWQSQAAAGRRIIRHRIELIHKTKVLTVIAGEEQHLLGEQQRYVWTIPQGINPNDEYKIKVHAWDDKGERGEALSSGSFVIQAVTERLARAQQEIIDRIRAVEIFSALTDEEVSHLAGKAIIQEYCPSELLVGRGQEGASMFIVHKGHVLVVTGHKGDQVVLARYGEGGTLGEITLLDGHHFSADYVADTEGCEVIEIGYQAMKEIFQANPTLIDTLCHALAESRAKHRATTDEQIMGEAKMLAEMSRNWYGIGSTSDVVESVEPVVDLPNHINKPWWKFW